MQHVPMDIGEGEAFILLHALAGGFAIAFSAAHSGRHPDSLRLLNPSSLSEAKDLIAVATGMRSFASLRMTE